MSEPHMRLTCLVDNATSRPDLKAEHGLAFLLETAGEKVLFDTGQTDLVLANAKTLGLDLAGVRTIVLSHGHYDHTGGLAAVLGVTAGGRLFAHPAAFGPHYSASRGSPRYVGMPGVTLDDITRAGWRVEHTIGPTQVAPGVHVTGAIRRVTSYEDIGGRFFVDALGRCGDVLPDDQAMVLRTRQGLVVVLGCAHAGVINTLMHIRRMFDDAPVHSVIGGMHLLQASPQRLAATMEALARVNVARLAPCHCTGAHATAMLWSSFPGRCQPCEAGVSFAFPI